MTNGKCASPTDTEYQSLESIFLIQYAKKWIGKREKACPHQRRSPSIEGRDPLIEPKHWG